MAPFTPVEHVKVRLRIMLTPSSLIQGLGRMDVEIKSDIKWILDTCTYAFDGLDILGRKFNQNSPFKGKIFEILLQAQFFNTRDLNESLNSLRSLFNTKGNTDALVFKHLIEKQEVNEPLFAYMMIVVEHCLVQWADFTCADAPFTDVVASKYKAHLQDTVQDYHLLKSEPAVLSKYDLEAIEAEAQAANNADVFI
ncbi:hypothetical protein BDZ89DRAFT_1138621 [Hymenopellis radicata]|nr:hypothetical protein BDZ89DRAFT_1138621 [Hymenopellis radicata]